MSAAFPASPKHRHVSRRERIGILLVVLLAPIAIYQMVAVRARQRELMRANLTELRVISQRDPNDLQVQFYLARRARKERAFGEALEAYNRVTAANPSDEQEWLEFAATAMEAGQPRGAAKVLETFCRANPSSERGRAALSDAY